MSARWTGSWSGSRARRRRPVCDGRLGGPGTLLMGEEAGEGLDGELVEALALRGEPLLERALRQRHAGQEVTAIEVADLLERGRAAVGDQTLELRDVDVDDRGVEGHGRPVEQEAGLRRRRAAPCGSPGELAGGCREPGRSACLPRAGPRACRGDGRGRGGAPDRPGGPGFSGSAGRAPDRLPRRASNPPSKVSLTRAASFTAPGRAGRAGPSPLGARRCRSPR